MNRISRFVTSYPLPFALLFSALMFLLCCLFIRVVLLPAQITAFDLSNAQNLGTSIGGLASPILGLGSTILLFLALSTQVRANEQQNQFNQRQIEFNSTLEQKNEADMILMLFDQFRNELNNFHYSFDISVKITDLGTTKIETQRFSGLEAWNKFNVDFTGRFAKQLAQLEERPKEGPYKFEDFFQSQQLHLLMNSMSLIRSRIESANLSQNNRFILMAKYDIYFQSYFQRQLLVLVDTLDKYPLISSWMSESIKSFMADNDKYLIESELES